MILIPNLGYRKSPPIAVHNIYFIDYFTESRYIVYAYTNG